MGLTPTGRTTVEERQLNREGVVNLRRLPFTVCDGRSSCGNLAKLVPLLTADLLLVHTHLPVTHRHKMVR